MRGEWVRPAILAASLAMALGHCVSGQTDVVTGCANGSLTCGVVLLGTHECRSGERAAGPEMPSCRMGEYEAEGLP